MAKKKNYLGELQEYQEKQYLPHTHHIQNGELPFSARQMMKQGAKRYIFLLLIAASASFALIIRLQTWLELPPEKLGIIVAVWAAAIVIAFALIIRGEAKRRAAAAAARNTQKSKKKKKK